MAQAMASVWIARISRSAIFYILLLMLFQFYGQAGGVPGAPEDDTCQEGCKRGFQPVCGEDNRTYATACVATCQGVPIAHYGPCEGEPIFHPANQHVVTGNPTPTVSKTAGKQTRPSSSSSSSSPSSNPTATTTSQILTRQRMDAFRHEGFRYAGQVTFSNTMAPRSEHNPPPHPPATASTATTTGSQPSATSGTGSGAPQPRVIRVTREGHLYTADLDDHVDTVLDALIERHANATSGATGAYTSAAHAAQMAHMHAMLLSLRQWRAFRPRGGAKAGEVGGSKWPRHAVVTATGTAGGALEHPLEPVLDATGLSGSFAAQRDPGRAEAEGQGQGQGQEIQGGAGAGAEAAADGEPQLGRVGHSGAAGGGAGASTQNLQLEKGEGAGQLSQEKEKEQEQKRDSGSKRSWGLTFGFGGDGQQRGDQAKQGQQRQAATAGSGSGAAGRDGASPSEGFHRPVRRNLGIFDSDDRVDCPRTPSYPFTAVGQINIRDPAGNYVCSGTLVGPDVVLTAAHCVFNRGAQTFYAKLDFAPARYRTLDGQVVNPFGVIAWSYVTVYQGYSSPSSADPNVQDIAVINLSERIGTQAGWMGVFEPCSPFAPTRYVALTAGYPSDQAPGSCKTTQCVVVQEPCTDGYLYHKCDTASGQSGSPLYMMAMTASKKMGPYVRGVHNIEWVQENANGQMVSYINSAVSITPDHYRSILAWIGLSFSVDGSNPMVPALPPPGSTATQGSNTTGKNSTATSTGRR